MPLKILAANRGEIAVRIFRAANELNIPTVAVYSQDDGASLHIRMADEAIALNGRGAAAYLNMDAILTAAQKTGCTAIHPGYGFLSENPEFAAKCAEAGLVFIGPSPENLRLFGDKTQARLLAKECGVPLLPGTMGGTSLDEVRSFMNGLGKDGAVMIKAVSGGGGRGMRPVYDSAGLEEAYSICRSEAQAAFGAGDLYVERLIPRARHIEIQVIGDGTGAVSHFWERECSLQRRNQKVVEFAPSPALTQELRGLLVNAALKMAEKVKLKSLATFEFLVDADAETQEGSFFFMEVNPRLQVEHTVTEEVTGVDLVQAQIRIAAGQTLADLGLEQKDVPAPLGYALQCRINAETILENGEVRPSGGRLESFCPPTGPGVRVDAAGYPGYEINPNFDSLLAKLTVHSRSRSFSDATAKAYRALCEFRIDGVAANVPLLQNLLIHPDVTSNQISTRFIEGNLATLANMENAGHPQLYFKSPKEHSFMAGSVVRFKEVQGPENTEPVEAPMQGTVVQFEAAEGDMVCEGQAVAILEAMKMQHLIKAPVSGLVRWICSEPGETLAECQPLMFVEPMDVDAAGRESEQDADLDAIRPDLAEVLERHKALMDEARPLAVERRRKTGQRTARENIDHLTDPGSFIEYGALALAAQRTRFTPDQLRERTPADGMITGIGAINGDLFGPDQARCAVLAYDFTVLAGTQGLFNHKKTDRMLSLARDWKLPLVLFAEGGGGRPGDVDAMTLTVAGLDLHTFTEFAGLSGLAPVVGVVSGRCFAGNAALLGCCDVIIAAKYSNIGMGGPAMIEGGGLGVCHPDEIGPIEIQSPNGVVDIVAEDEFHAVEAAKQYLSYFQGAVDEWNCADQRLLRRCIPENRLRSYDIRKVVHTLADEGSVLELRRDFGVGILTALVRMEGQPFGLTANNSMHLGGAIDADAADKAARFMQLCDAFDIPMIALSDTPGFMVGPEAEKTAQVRHFCRMFNTGASVTIPLFSVVLRKGYGLGAMAMVGGGYHSPVFNIAWPTGEFGGMGLEGAVRLGFKKELDAVDDPKEKQALFETMVAAAYEHGKATNMASFLEIDGVIDPAETRAWIMRGFHSMPKPEKRQGKKRPNIDVW
ncbi:carboxyl transferase domain-containing protein [Desulfatibacillum aliphaticivorans]|uniref:carboxyl transferase domain-containing protein n=1 Tax=Desulfatibacillum aliphaticivorans TaxID=218208 RepID=UPI0003F8EE3A|nr:carboxyl transferase domain-containing protein [Desulfatibacillum aliphaticivorans]